MAETRRVGVVGVSTTASCGVRDHAMLQARALEERGITCTEHWLARDGDASLGASRARVRAWTRALPDELRAEELDAVLFHYSVFSYAYRGVPVFVHGALAALERAQLPLLSVLHEFAYPWRRSGARGALWAVTQRALLIDVMHRSAAVAVTMSWRAEWLASRAWLPARRTAVAPVFSNLPVARGGLDGDARTPVIGLFGYAYERHVVALVIDAMRVLERAGVAAQLLLIGAPGRDSELAREWLAQARAAGLERPPEFSGLLPAQELSDLLAGCEVLLSAEPSGPTSRKTTLAASLASGRPLVALDGPRSWTELARADAALLAPARAGALADALTSLLSDREQAARLGARGREFAERTMTSAHNAAVIAGLLEELLSGRS